jgi:hypothetical protein
MNMENFWEPRLGPLKEALILAQDLGIQRLLVSSDCLEIVNALKNKNLSVYSSILVEIESRPSSFEVISFQHESRDSNGDAHLVARNAISQSFGRRLWLIDPPDYVNLYATV